MSWFRRNSTSLPVQQVATPAASRQPDPPTDAQLPPTSSPLTNPDDEVEVVDEPPRGTKRKASEDTMDIDSARRGFVYNSSGVCPDDSTRHNDRVTKSPPGEHLLHLPRPVQQLIFTYVLISHTPYKVNPNGKMIPQPVVYWKIREDRSLTKKAREKHDGRAICKPPGLLTVCRRIRELALPVFYVGNDFEVRIRQFCGENIIQWWTRIHAHRSRAAEKPIVLAGLDDNSDQQASTCQSELQLGLIELDVDYEPNWDNLVSWLDLCHKGKLPAYDLADLQKAPRAREHQTVAWLFQIVYTYTRAESDGLHRNLETHRRHLIRDDERWTPPEDRAPSPHSSYTVDEETQYHHANESLGSGFCARGSRPEMKHGSGQEDGEEDEEVEQQHRSIRHSGRVEDVSDKDTDMEIDHKHRHKRHKSRAARTFICADSDDEVYE